jgi:hypothetical protein
MRFMLALIFAIFATQASSQTQQTPAPATSPQVSTPPSGSQTAGQTGAAKTSNPVSRTRLTCSQICRSGMQSVLAGKDLDEFNACADLLLCLEGYPPVASERRDFLNPFFGLDIFRSGPDVKG